MELYFSVYDYIVFGSMLAISGLIGVYFGFCRTQKQNTTAEYLLGSKKMGVFPVAISLTATHISAVTMLGVPAEMYLHGTQYWVCAISGLVVTIAMSHLYLPVFMELQITSCYGYLEKRFGVSLRNLASGLYTLCTILGVPVLIYAPAIAFSQVTGINLHIITPVMCVICIFYTTIGGIRAVVWTDTIQFLLMVGALVVVIIMGTNMLGGFAEVFRIADRGERIIIFDMNTDPFVRSSFWMVSIGLTTMWISNIGVSPECVQRFLAIPTLSDSRKVVWIFGIGHIIIKLCSVYNGLIVYGKYADCDPVSNGSVKKADQIFAYYVLDVASSIPGLSGLFVAGIFSAALSSMSSCMNTLAGTFYMDFVKHKYPSLSDETGSRIMKLLVVVIGTTCLGLVFVVEKLGNIFSLGISIGGVTAGTLLGIFTLGMVCPRANTTGARWGAYASLIIVSGIVLGAQLNIMEGNLKYTSLPFNLTGCNNPEFANTTSIILNEHHDNSNVPWIFRIGFMYYSVIGAMIVFIVGYPVSILTGGHDDIDERLLAPFLRGWYRRRRKAKNLPKGAKPDQEMHLILTPDR
ncbi:sodium-coupled monocarboxylate transporter 2-like [Phlebotomus argentipes]|uniref:sodium-coupled monocarboxylate transporter 2-like n=1 Tax=Phlebotomus argentipes TaxID=94469 RepID=UPI0028933821|nr:sodium-coupled monocarboxylate transporter 2-like [Phlebotomus argentipes]